jgi:hypothetical protein
LLIHHLLLELELLLLLLLQVSPLWTHLGLFTAGLWA